MVFDWYIAEMQLRYDERIREIECRQYLFEVEQANPKPHITDRALAGVGHLLIEWGRHLEARHSIAYAHGMADGSDAVGELVIESVPPRASARGTGRAYRR
jgi:hypothetical protein